MNSQQVRTSVGIKMLIIGGLVFLLLIPSLMIHFIIYERENRRREVLRDITSKWGEVQQITGPVMSIPVEYLHLYMHARLCRQDKRHPVTHRIRTDLN